MMSTKTAIKAVGKAPAHTMLEPSDTFKPLDIISPRPPAPMNVPTAVTPIATTKAFLIPPKMTEIASNQL